MKLIKEWREAWKFTSVQTTLLLAAMSGAYARCNLQHFTTLTKAQ